MSKTIIEEHISIDSQDFTNNYTQWQVLNNKEYLPAYKTVKSTPAGFYEAVFSQAAQAYVLKGQDINIDELYELPSDELMDIIEDIKKFWESTSKYKKYKFVHKRGLLLYGTPGCGKSGIIQLITKHLIEKLNGIVLNITNGNSLEIYNNFIPLLRAVEPNRSIIVILEDIDSIAGEDKYYGSLLLNLLDGVKQIGNVVYIATTNYPEKLEERMCNRPSRFDRRYEIELPNKKVREAYLNNKLDKEDLNKIDLNKWVDETEGMSLAHLRELVISVMVLDNSFEDAIAKLNGLKIKPIIKSKTIKKIGFGNTTDNAVACSGN